MKTRSKAYWSKRAIGRLTSAEKSTLPYLRKIQRIYTAAARATVEDVKRMYAAYYKNDGTFDVTALNRIAARGDVQRFLSEMQRLGLTTYLPDNYKGRMTRLQLLNAQMWAEVHKAAKQEQELSTQAYKGIIEEGYYRVGYDMSKGLGENLSFSKLDTATVQQVLDSKFYGEDFSQRIWRSTDRIAEQLGEIVGQGIASGQSSAKVARLIRDRFAVKNYEAKRLVRTETNYFANKAEIMAYEEIGIDKYIFIAVLDNRTSEICQDHDGDIFEVSKAVQGDNVPPLHPNCRSTIIAYLGPEFMPKTRIARNPATGKNEKIEYMSYKDWRASLDS